MVNGTFWKISEISSSDLANSSYGCSPHEKIAKNHWLRLSMNKNFPYSHTTSLSCKCCYFMQTHQKHLHKTQTLHMHFKHFGKKKHQTFFMHTQPKKKQKFRNLKSDLKCNTIFSHTKNTFVKRSFSHSQCSNRNNMM
jgi:hypothetical protein